MVVKKQSTKTAQLYAYSFDRETWQGDFKYAFYVKQRLWQRQSYSR